MRGINSIPKGSSVYSFGAPCCCPCRTISRTRVHPHQLRHACGYYLATSEQDTRAIQDYLGHRNIQHTVRYTQLNPSRFESFWTD
ncbi:tyrosine-type recombinase/integrase [Zarconia navalis]|uniref:tyrosine-type recombinase/integrase n=1 Tax=Zarconia navalis TaxID=2992134 RepID=UPI0029C89B1E|nr:tyrosine-type recombinase/integrase [Zarconia navalis]